MHHHHVLLLLVQLLLLLQVCAKGKGGRMRAPMAPTGEMVRVTADCC